MGLLSIAQDVCSEIGLRAPNAIAASSNSQSKQLFALAKTELRELSQNFMWPDLITEHEFSTVADTASYNLPTDFASILTQTAYKSSQYYALRGSMSPQAWQRRRVQAFGLNVITAFRVYKGAGVMTLDPTPSAAEDIIFEYRTKNYALDSNGDPIPTFMTDSDEPRVPSDVFQMGLKWRLLKAKGIDFSVELAEYVDAAKRSFAQQLASDDIMMTAPQTGYAVLTEGYVPDTGFGAS